MFLLVGILDPLSFLQLTQMQAFSYPLGEIKVPEPLKSIIEIGS